MAKGEKSKSVDIEALRHKDRRKNIPTEELRDFVAEDEAKPKVVPYPRDPSLDPQLVWKGKDEQDSEDLEVPVVPVYIQEKIHPKYIIEDLRAQAKKEKPEMQPQLFADFNGIQFEDLIEFYQHEQNWSNRMILGDSLLVMTSLAEKEGLKGKVQMIYIDPPYGIKFASNWQVSTRQRDVKDGKTEDATRQPEQIKAFRDTWKLGIHSYLAYLRDRLVVARDLLAETGSIFVQIGDENVHLVRCLMDEVFGEENFMSLISVKRASVMFAKKYLNTACFFIVWYSKDIEKVKYHDIFEARDLDGFAENTGSHLWIEKTDLNTVRKVSPEERKDLAKFLKMNSDFRVFGTLSLNAQGTEKQKGFEYEGKTYHPPPGTQWKTSYDGLQILANLKRLIAEGNTLRYKQYLHDYPVMPINSLWIGIGAASDKIYVVQTPCEIIQRCLLMTTDPGDLVVDPTCGSGTTAYVAEE